METTSRRRRGANRSFPPPASHPKHLALTFLSLGHAPRARHLFRRHEKCRPHSTAPSRQVGADLSAKPGTSTKGSTPLRRSGCEATQLVGRDPRLKPVEIYESRRWNESKTPCEVKMISTNLVQRSQTFKFLKTGAVTSEIWGSQHTNTPPTTTRS